MAKSQFLAAVVGVAVLGFGSSDATARSRANIAPVVAAAQAVPGGHLGRLGSRGDHGGHPSSHDGAPVGVSRAAHTQRGAAVPVVSAAVVVSARPGFVGPGQALLGSPLPSSHAPTSAARFIKAQPPRATFHGGLGGHGDAVRGEGHFRRAGDRHALGAGRHHVRAFGYAPLVSGVFDPSIWACHADLRYHQSSAGDEWRLRYETCRAGY